MSRNALINYRFIFAKGVLTIFISGGRILLSFHRGMSCWHIVEALLVASAFRIITRASAGNALVSTYKTDTRRETFTATRERRSLYRFQIRVVPIH